MRGLNLLSLAIFLVLTTLQEAWSHGDQPLSKIAIHKATVDLNRDAYIKASPTVLGLNEQTTEWVTLEYSSPKPSADDWIGVFSPANFNASTCPEVNPRVYPPLLCSAPIKYQFANYSSPEYKDTGKGYLKLQLINQRTDFSFALFSGGLSNPKLVAVSNQVAFANPNAPVYPRLAQGKQWNEMTVTWTSGYGINEAGAFVEWGPKGGDQVHSLAGTLTFDRNSMCDAPARTVGWRDPGFIHTSFLNELWPNVVYTYKLGHKLFNGTYVRSQHMFNGTFNCSWVMPHSVLGLLRCWQGSFGRHRNGFIWSIIPHCLLWCLWRERNSRCFEDSERSIPDLKLLFFRTLRDWLFALQNKSFPSFIVFLDSCNFRI